MDELGAQMFGRLPYFDPFMSINLSTTCATTKLIQCIGFGTVMCDVTRKFLNQPQEQATDLGKEDFYARKELIENVMKWEEERSTATKKVQNGPDIWTWTPILYAYEIVKGSMKKQEDVGHMVFTDPTLTRFLMVNLFGPPTCDCGNPYHSDYAALTKLHADRFMSLLKYIYHKPDNPKTQWIRATYTTNSQGLNPAFLVSANTSIPPDPPSKNVPPIFNFFPDSFKPSLTEHYLERIDTLLGRSNSFKNNMPSPEVRAQVTGKGDRIPSKSRVLLEGQQLLERQCGNCERVGSDLKVCSRCKMVFFCGSTCQKAAWPRHKLVCMAPAK